MDDIKNNIFYRPEVDIERNYDTTGVIPKVTPEPAEEPVTPTPEQKLMERAEIVENKLLRIRGVLPMLPNGVPEILRDIVDKLIFQTEDEKDKIENIPENPEEERTEINEANPQPPDDSEIIIDDEGFIWNEPEPDTYTIKVIKCKSNPELALEQYLKDSLDIKEDFINKMNEVMEDYIYPIISVMNESGVPSIQYLNMEYDGACVTGYVNDDRHLNDIAATNQTLIDEQTRLFQKTHDANTTFAILMAFDVTAQERIRYYEENYNLGITNFVSMYRRNTLEKIRNTYNYKYRKARNNVYKYLNSAAEATRKILKNALDANTAKCYLLTQDVNIFARTEYQAVAYENATNAGAAEVDPNTNTPIEKATDTTKKESDSKSELDSLKDTASSALNDLKNTAGSIFK